MVQVDAIGPGSSAATALSVAGPDADPAVRSRLVAQSSSVAADAGRMGEARAAALLGRHDDAVRWFEEAIAIDTRAGARPYVALDRLRLAQGLLARAAGTDLARAETLARQAANEMRRLGMPGPARRAGELLERVHTADPLTSREREIATLVADSLSNRQIADRLVLSERTVESHVRSILAKLGLANRIEVAEWTRRPGAAH